MYVGFNSLASPRKAITLLATSALALALSGGAHAQNVSYDQLQQLFGEPVTTSVTGKPQRASDAPASLVIITREDIRRSPAKDVPGLIQAYAGIDVVRWTGGHSDVAIRGGVKAYNSSLLVLVNGRQVYLDHFGMTNWNGIGVQLEEILQIEVVQGPNSALFGFNAASGVINIITVDPLQTRQLVTTVEAGTGNHLRFSQSAALKIGDDMGVRLSGGYERSDELSGFATSVLAVPNIKIADIEHWEASGELYIKPDSQTQASLSLTHSRNSQIDLVPVLYADPQDFKITSIGARASRDTGWGVLSASAYRNVAEIVSGGASFTRAAFKNKVLVGSTNALIRAGTSDVLRFGLEYRVNEVAMDPGYPGKTRYAVLAGSGMWERKLGDLLTLTIAGRLDHLKLEQTGIVDQPTIFTKEDFDRSITEWSFNGALLFKLDELSSLRVSGGRGIEAPSLFAFGQRLPIILPGVPLPLIAAGDPAIDPTIATSAEIGFVRRIDHVGGRLELTGFYSRATDVIGISGPQAAPRATPPAYPFIFFTTANAGTFNARGVAVSLIGKSGTNWSWSLNYTWTRTDQDIVGNAGGVYQRLLALDKASPEHKVKAQLSYEHGPWLATVAARYTSGIDQLMLGAFETQLVKVRANVGVDAKIACKIGSALTVAVTGENLTDNKYVGLSPGPAERRLRVNARISL